MKHLIRKVVIFYVLQLYGGKLLSSKLSQNEKRIENEIFKYVQGGTKKVET